MFKTILISGLLCTYLSADSFDTFLQKAINNSTYLKSSALEVDQSRQYASVITRYKNPSLELEYSHFNPSVGSNDEGYRVSVSQPVRLWGISKSREKLATQTVENANATYKEKKSMFIRDISLSYASYTNSLGMYNLVKDELSIAKIIFDISSSRYKAGTISKGLMLGSQIDYEMVQIKNESLALKSNQAYDSLLILAGINEDIHFDKTHTFKTNNNFDSANNVGIILLKSEQNIALSQVNLSSNKIEWMDIFAEFESETEQDITRLGMNIPLALFNTKSQERSIANLKNTQTQLLIDNEEKRVEMTNKRLNKERASFKRLLAKNKVMLGSQNELLVMFQNGYKIANINLLELQNIKNKVIATKKSIIQIKTALDKNAILLNYNQGHYND